MFIPFQLSQIQDSRRDTLFVYSDPKYCFKFLLWPQILNKNLLRITDHLILNMEFLLWPQIF